MKFLSSFDCAEDAWGVLSAFAEDASVLLTVTQDGFEGAFRRARRFMRRAEQIDRDDINVMLQSAGTTKTVSSESCSLRTGSD